MEHRVGQADRQRPAAQGADVSAASILWIFAIVVRGDENEHAAFPKFTLPNT
jgi:hypothetical protein